MPTRKQRRRREKGRRHEYEVVYVDDEGRELPPEEVEEVAARNGGRKHQQKPAAGGRGVRPVQPASWRRVLKRGLIFAPFMFLLITFLSPDLTTVQTLVQTAFLLLIFLPFSYVMDSITYRMITKRQAKIEAGSGAEKR